MGPLINLYPRLVVSLLINACTHKSDESGVYKTCEYGFDIELITAHNMLSLLDLKALIYAAHEIQPIINDYLVYLNIYKGSKYLYSSINISELTSLKIVIGGDTEYGIFEEHYINGHQYLIMHINIYRAIKKISVTDILDIFYC